MKQKTSHGISFALLLVLALPTLVGCEDSGSSRTVTGDKRTLTYLVSAESTVYKNILQTVIDDFNASVAEEGYEIVTETPGGDYYTSLGTKFASNTAPDIFMMESGFFNAYSGSLLPLDSYLDASSTLSQDDLWYLNDSYKKDGKLLALIKDFSPDFMFIYNKTMVEQYNASHPSTPIVISQNEPMTWAELYSITSTIQNAQNVQYGTSLGFEPVKHLHEWVQMTGSSMYTNGDTELNIGNADVRSAFELYCALQKDNATEFPTYLALNQNEGTAPASFTSGSNVSEQELFKQGKAFSIFNGLYAFSAFDFYNLGFDVGIAPSPVQHAEDDPYSTTSAMVAHAISKTSKYPDIAYRFVEFYQTEGLERFAEIGFNIPGNKTIAGSPAFLGNENPKISAMATYFYNYVNAGHVQPTLYNANISYRRVETCFTSQLAKYYDGQLTFSELLDNINKSIKASV